jgi:hypothetical protein
MRMTTICDRRSANRKFIHDINMLFFSCKAIRNSISGFFVDRYDTIWYMRLWVDDLTPKDRGGVYCFGRLSHLGAARVVSCGVIWDFVS